MIEEEVRQIQCCDVCGEERLDVVLDLALHPLCDDLVPVGDSRMCKEYPVRVLLCPTCCTAHQSCRIQQEELFPPNYHYRSRFTRDVLDGMSGLVDSCERLVGDLRGKAVIDVGCNDGSLLDRFRSRGAITIGIEPTDAFRDAQEKGHVVYNEFLSSRLAEAIALSQGGSDLVTFTNVFAHVDNLPAVLEALTKLMRPQTVLVIENHYLGDVLSGNQFDTFYHEHARTYSYTSFEYVARGLGCEVLDVEFPCRYGGNIRVFLGDRAAWPVARDQREELIQRERLFREQFVDLSRNVERWRATKREFILQQVREFGRLAAKAFPARAAIAIKLLGLDETSIAAVYEKPGSMKIGHYVPGTRIPIESDEKLFAELPKTAPILNLAWHIPREIRTYLAEHQHTAPVFDIVSPEDFVRSNR